jgi:hypothetical protein
MKNSFVYLAIYKNNKKTHSALSYNMLLRVCVKMYGIKRERENICLVYNFYSSFNQPVSLKNAIKTLNSFSFLFLLLLPPPL